MFVFANKTSEVYFSFVSTLYNELELETGNSPSDNSEILLFNRLIMLPIFLFIGK